jgi:hypothetical protein
MINWEKEIATKNYCGYCNGAPTGCNSDCFKDSYTPKAMENRVDHVLTMLRLIPEQIEKLKEKETNYKETLKVNP